jgi:hypothetical protein
MASWMGKIRDAHGADKKKLHQTSIRGLKTLNPLMQTV